MRKRKIKYISIKLPACNNAYPLDKYGCHKMPAYTPQYLKKHGRKLFYILMNKVPSSVYSELTRCIKKDGRF